MPSKTIDYSKATIYRIVCKDLDVKGCYVGGTTNFNARKARHKFACNNPSGKGHESPVYQAIREHGGWQNWMMVQIEQFQCATRRELDARERHWMETLGATLNHNIPYRANRQEYNQQYYIDNVARFKENTMAYYRANADKYKRKAIMRYRWNKAAALFRNILTPDERPV